MVFLPFPSRTETRIRNESFASGYGEPPPGGKKAIPSTKMGRSNSNDSVVAGSPLSSLIASRPSALGLPGSVVSPPSFVWIPARYLYSVSPGSVVEVASSEVLASERSSPFCFGNS